MDSATQTVQIQLKGQSHQFYFCNLTGCFITQYMTFNSETYDQIIV